jgi:hypothetical protein
MISKEEGLRNVEVTCSQGPSIVAVKDDDPKVDSNTIRAKIQGEGSSLNRPSTLTVKFFAKRVWVDSHA